MKILFLTARLPYPLDSGAKIRAFHILRSLATIHEVTLLSFCGSYREIEYVNKFTEWPIKVIPVINSAIDKGYSVKTIFRSIFSDLPITVAKYDHVAMRSAILDAIKDDYDVVHCEHIHMVQYVDKSIDAKLVVDEHNVECQIIARMLAMAKLWNITKKILLRWHYLKTRRYEQSVLNRCDLVLSVSEEDRVTLATLSDSVNLRVVENGVNVNHFINTDSQSSSKNLVFVGSMDWSPNIDGILYFLETILPIILSREPETCVYIVGKNPPQYLTEACKRLPSVHVTGSVEDVRPYVRDASVIVVPLRVGGGTRLKVLEAFAMGKAVVSTSLGCEGILCRDGEHLLVADDPIDFADAVQLLLNNSALNEKLGRNARSLAESEYSWTTIGNKLLKYYDSLFT